MSLSQNELAWLATPSGFARGLLGMGLYPKQAAVMDALQPVGSTVSFKSCNEGGKTRKVICGTILWHLAQFPFGHVVSTSGSYRQIADQLLPALHGYRGKFPRWEFLQTPRIQTERLECYFDGFSTNDAGKFEGHHAGSDLAAKHFGADYDMHRHAPLLIIVDEAKTVPQAIFTAIERCKPTRLLLCSSPGYAEGEFYASHTTKARFYKTFTQKASECPHITPEEIQKTREKWAGAPEFVASMLDAEFMPMVEGAVINLRALEDLLADPPRFDPSQGQRKAFCDFAWSGSGDENAMALREGNRVTLPLTFRSGNLYELCGRFVAAWKQRGLKPEEIEGDEGGGGKLVCDALAEMGWNIVRVNNQEAPRWDEQYANLAAETWHEGGRVIQRRDIILPDDNDLRGQLMDRKQKVNAKGKLAIESKDDMRKRGVPSPDRADAVLGAMSPRAQQGSVSLSAAPQTFEELLNQAGEQTDGEQLERMGIWAG